MDSLWRTMGRIDVSVFLARYRYRVTPRADTGLYPLAQIAFFMKRRSFSQGLHSFVMQFATGLELPSSTSRSASPSTLPCASGATATPVHCAHSLTACLPLWARSSQPGPVAYLVSQHNIMQSDPRTLRGVTALLSDPVANREEYRTYTHRGEQGP